MPKTFILTDETINSYGFRLSTAKLKLTRFKANPVMLYNHNELVGKWDNIRIEGDKLMADCIFMDNENEELATKISKRVDGGFVNGASVGLNIIDIEWIGDIPIVTAEILECSVVDIPSNKNAVVLMNKDGQILESQDLTLSLDKFKNPKAIHTMKLNATNLLSLSLDADATEDQINAAMVKLSTEHTELKTKHTELVTKVKADQELKVKTLVDDAFTLGKINADEKPHYIELANVNFELAIKTLSKLTGKKKLPITTGSNTGIQLEDRSVWTAKDWRQKDTAGFLAMKKEDPEKYAALNATDKY